MQTMIGLEQKDLNLFRSYISAFAESKDSEIFSSIAETPELLKFWNENKSKYLFKMFGDKVILEREIEYTQSLDQIIEAFQDELVSHPNSEMAQFRNKYLSALDTVFGYGANEYYYASRLVNSRSLADNVCSHCEGYPSKIVFPNGHTVTVADGAKVMRILGKISKELGLAEDFEKFRLKHSLLLNQKKLKGTLCLSIHPLDYLTMSDNANNWTSCMSWIDDGDYRGGTVEMMNSPCVVVAYLKSSNKELTWNVTEHWNSKLWRSLIVVTPETIATVKSYPYYNEELLKTSVSWVHDLVTENLGWDYHSDILDLNPGGATELPDGQVVRLCFSAGRMYNDFGNSTHWGYLSKELPTLVDIYYSGPSQCMICGRVSEEYDYYDSNYVACRGCCDASYDNYSCCDRCGEIYHSDDIYWVEDQPLCRYCFDEAAGECDMCGEYYYLEDLYQVRLASTPDKPDDGDPHLDVCERYLGARPYAPGTYTNANYCTQPPRLDEETGYYYWNESDWSERGLKEYWGIF